MKRKSQKIRRIRKRWITLLVGIFILGGLATAWANVSYVKPHDVTHPVQLASKSDIPLHATEETRGRAPEPATMALFGSGFFGMLMTFLRRTYAFAKRIFDIISAIIGIVVLSPLMILAGILVKATSKGPMLYSQVRVGRGGKSFRMFKFRTMVVDAEKASGPVWAQKNDSRITPVGNLFRKMRIDELPQFFNVLRGDMSLIGPRPERPTFVAKLKEQVPNYEGRLAVKPGITGLAQVRHRYDETIEDVKKKVKYDLFYIKNMNVWHDLGIVFRTVGVVLTGFGAR